LKTGHHEDGETEELYYHNELWGRKVDPIGSGLIPIAGFFITRFAALDLQLKDWLV
jgi:hypothetical protein